MVYKTDILKGVFHFEAEPAQHCQLHSAPSKYPPRMPRKDSSVSTRSKSFPQDVQDGIC